MIGSFWDGRAMPVSGRAIYHTFWPNVGKYICKYTSPMDPVSSERFNIACFHQVLKFSGLRQHRMNQPLSHCGRLRVLGFFTSSTAPVHDPSKPGTCHRSAHTAHF